MKEVTTRDLLHTLSLFSMSTAVAVTMHRQDRTVFVVLWATVAILHGIRLGILVWKMRGQKRTGR